MREIKFRIYDKNKKKMFYQDDTFWSGANGFVEIANIYTGYSDSYEWENYALMQFTGLRDRNGREIWEGDIVKNILIRPITVDVFHGYRFMWGKDQLCKSDAIDGEVIGNIYENKELLCVGE